MLINVSKVKVSIYQKSAVKGQIMCTKLIWS